MSWSLYDSVLGTLDLSHENGILVEEFEPGFPNVRSDVQDRAVAHGVDDYTSYFGSRQIAVSGKLIHTPEMTLGQVRQRLLTYLMPNRRPVLTWTDNEGITKTIRVRVDKFDQSVLLVVDDFRLNWVAEPFWSLGTIIDVIPHSEMSELGGMSWPWLGSPSAVVSFEQGTLAVQTIENAEAVETWPIFTIVGPVSSPVIENLDTGEKMKIDITVDAGSSLVIDTKNHTAILNGTTSVFQNFDFNVTTWWPIRPGTQRIIFQGTKGIGDLPYASISYDSLTL